MKKYAIMLLVAAGLSACSQTDTDHDSEGKLLAEKLENSSGGGFNFSPMQDDDSMNRVHFTPDIYTYNGEPYTGAITAYDDKERKIFDGNLEKGIADGSWKFYYPSGVVQIEGVYAGGLETGLWKSYYSADHPKVIKDYDAQGKMLMRAEYFDNGRIKNYQNIATPEYGGIARRIQFTYDGTIDYLDAERDLGKMEPGALHDLLVRNGLKK